MQNTALRIVMRGEPHEGRLITIYNYCARIEAQDSEGAFEVIIIFTHKARVPLRKERLCFYYNIPPIGVLSLPCSVQQTGQVLSFPL